MVRVNVTFRNVDATDPLKEHAISKVTHCVEKFVHKDVIVHVTLSVEKTRQIAEAKFQYDGGRSIVAVEESSDLYASIDKLVDNLSGQIRKHKEKLVAHH